MSAARHGYRPLGPVLLVAAIAGWALVIGAVRAAKALLAMIG